MKQVEEMDIPGVDDAKRVGRRPDWVPAQAERPALATIGVAEVEKRALVRFALFTALRERRVTPREVSIVRWRRQHDDSNDGEKLWDMRNNSDQCEV